MKWLIYILLAAMLVLPHGGYDSNTVVIDHEVATDSNPDDPCWWISDHADEHWRCETRKDSNQYISCWKWSGSAWGTKTNTDDEGDANNCEVDQARDEMFLTDPTYAEVHVFEMPPQTPSWPAVRTLSVGSSPYGVAIGHERPGGRSLLFVLQDTCGLTVYDAEDGSTIRTITTNASWSTCEGVSTDDVNQRVIVCEDGGSYACEVFTFAGTQVGSAFGVTELGGQAEGNTVYWRGGSKTYYIYSDQQADPDQDFEVYTGGPGSTFTHLCTFEMDDGASDNTNDTDGIDIEQWAGHVSPWEEGAFLACDGCGAGGTDELDMVDWDDIATSTDCDPDLDTFDWAAMTDWTADANIEGCYSFEAGSGIIDDDSKDADGSTHCGTGADDFTNSGATTYYEMIQWNGKAGNFESGESDYMGCTVGNCGELDLNGADQEISVCTWVRFETLDADQVLYSHYNDSDGARAVRLWMDDGTPDALKFCLTPSACGAAAEVCATATETLAIDTNYHVCGTYDDVNIRIYVDGEFQAKTAHTTGICDSAADIRIGADGSSVPAAQNFLDGRLDELLVFSDALLHEEVCELARFGVKGVGFDRGFPCAARFIEDTFERASLGGNWTQATSSARDITITGSSDVVASSAGVTMAYWDAWIPPSEKTYACAKITGTDDDQAGVCLALESTGDGVCCVTSSTGSYEWEMIDYSNEAENSALEQGTTPAFAPGDFIGIQRTASTSYRCYRSDDGKTWTAIGSSQTSSQGENPGRYGVVAYQTSSADVMLENFEGGNGNPLDEGLSSVCGTSTGAGIAFDSASSDSAASATSMSWSHTLNVGSGNNRVVLIGSCGEDGSVGSGEISNVTFNSQAMTDFTNNAYIQTTDSTKSDCDWWYGLDAALPANPGTYTVAFDYAGTVNYATSFAIVLTGAGTPVDVATALRSPETSYCNSACADPYVTNITTNNNESWIVDACGSGNDGSWGVITGQVIRVDVGSGSTMKSVVSTKATVAAGATSMSEDHDTPNRFVHSLIEVPLAGATTTTTSTTTTTTAAPTTTTTLAPSALYFKGVEPKGPSL